MNRYAKLPDGILGRLLKGESIPLAAGGPVGARKILSTEVEERLLARYGVGKERSLYVRRNLLNADRFVAWAKAAGFGTTMPAEEIHATVCYSKGPVKWATFIPDAAPLVVKSPELRKVKPLGKDGAVVLGFSSEDLAARHKAFRDGGATWDHPSYQPHVTITYDGTGVDPEAVEPFGDDLIFGPEVFEEIDEGWADRIQEKLAKCRLGLKVEKTEPDRMEAYGWASVVEIDGKPVVDLDNEVITEADLDAFVRKFVLGHHGGKVMHEGQIEADLIESIMFTKEKQAALKIDLGRVGWWIGMKYRRPEVWAKLKSGELPMFSLSGYAVPKPIPANGA